MDDASDVAGPRLRLAVLGDLDGMHTQGWLSFFTERGHEVHAISFYPPSTNPSGATVHVLKKRARGGPAETGSAPAALPALRRLLPPSLERLVQYGRYAHAGLARVVREIDPDVLHAHFVVEHGFYGSAANFHPFVVSAWGSDIFRAPKTSLGRFIAKRALKSADLVTVNDPEMSRQVTALGVTPDRVALVRLGVDREFLAATARPLNHVESSFPRTLISDRALEPLYNVDSVIQAFALARGEAGDARLLIAHDGSQRGHLGDLVRSLGLESAIEFLGHLDRETLRERLGQSDVYISVPSSDSLSVSTMEAMAAGVFPIVSDLPSQRAWIEHGVNGLRVAVRDVGALAAAMTKALSDVDLRRKAAALNRAKVEAEGARDRNMLVLERHYYRLAGKPLATAP